MHGLFDHGPVFSVVVQIIFQTGWATACGMEVRYLLNERKTAWTRRNARLQDHCRNDGQLQELQERDRYWKTACDKNQ